MNFDFIPFKLNADLSQFKSQIHYISSDNGVELYKAGEELKNHFLGISITEVNLYFFEGSLITVYIQLGEDPDNIEAVKKTLEYAIKKDGKALKLSFGSGYGWNSQNKFLALMRTESINKLMLYFSLSEFAVFA